MGGDQAEWFIKHLKDFQQRLAPFNPVATVEHLKFAFLAAAGFGNGKKRRIETMAEHGEHSDIAIMIDRIVTPFALCNATAINIQ